LAREDIDFKLRLSLREGTIYYFTDRSLTSSEPHYFIVVNSDPLTQKVVLLSVVTSQIEKVRLRRKLCPETLVELSPSICNVFKKDCIIDCNDLKEVAIGDFNTRFVGQSIRYFDKDLPTPLRKALRKAIHASALLSDEQKSLVGKP
jgi:hypothetical protein